MENIRINSTQVMGILILIFGAFLALTICLSWKCKKKKGSVGGVLSTLNMFFGICCAFYAMCLSFSVDIRLGLLFSALAVGGLLAFIIYRICKSKKEKEPIGCVIRIFATILSLCFIFNITCLGYWCYTTIPETELYRDQTHDGHEFVIYEKGHPKLWLERRHLLVVEVDGQALFQFYEVYPDGLDEEKVPIFPAEKIVCLLDDTTEYQIAFRFSPTVDQQRMRFSSDFRTIHYLACAEADFLVDWLEVVEWHNWQLSPW